MLPLTQLTQGSVIKYFPMPEGRIEAWNPTSYLYSAGCIAKSRTRARKRDK